MYRSTSRKVLEKVAESQEVMMTVETDDHIGDYNLPLCVDLDGTLVRTDVLVEAIFSLLKRRITYILLFPIWILKGRAFFKHQVAKRVELDVECLPYVDELVQYLRVQKNNERVLILCTGANQYHAKQVARYLELFNCIYASDEYLNFSGAQKRQRLLEEFGDQGFDYIGNAAVDLKVWSVSRRAILVNTRPQVRRRAEAIVHVEQVLENPYSRIEDYFGCLRPSHWLKNLLVFVPLVMAHQIQDLSLLGRAGLAFVSFSLAASSVYVLNDLLDLSTDRRHPINFSRSLPAGRISIKNAAALVPTLLLAACGVAAFLPLEFFGFLAAYVLVSTAYSLKLKQIVVLDVLILSSLYTIRLAAGAASVTVPLSYWLLTFSLLVFLSLALGKRYSEVTMLNHDGCQNLSGRGYKPKDLTNLSRVGQISGYLAAIILAFYVNSVNASTLYAYPMTIWLLCPLLVYWISHFWRNVRQANMTSDPIVFCLGDQVSRWTGVLVILILWVAT